MALVALLFVFIGLPYTLVGVGGMASASGTGTSLEPTPSSGRATLALKSVRPIVVVGRGFKAGEHVRITGAGTKALRASAAGSFSTRLGSRDACQGFTIVAVGSRGSRATLNFAQISNVHCLER